jgi:hypothetical protein
MTTDDSPRVIRLVREVDRLRHDLATEQTRSGALKMQNDRLRKAVVALRRQQMTAERASADGADRGDLPLPS